MNILIPDSWLRDYLKTKATPKDIKEYLSLCGPSVERIHTVNRETIYDIEITTNRIDSYSVYGIAREAAAILPRFGIPATVLPLETKLPKFSNTQLGISITDRQSICRRILAVKICGITLGSSPVWLAKRLELVGQRTINTVVDITNYVMWETGHPVHAFDYDRLINKTIIVREARKGEHAISLDNKKHAMKGKEVIFDDGTGTIIDIPGIMGTANTVITPETKNVLLFIENTPPEKIRYTSMTHAIRTQAAIINEKDPDPELAYTAMCKAVNYTIQLTNGSIGSKLYDHYQGKIKPPVITVSRSLIRSYMGIDLETKQIADILTPLGFKVSSSENSIHVVTPAYRRDVTIPVDIIEEIARIYGYHAIPANLPGRTPPPVNPDPILTAEESIRTVLQGWGMTEVYGYSMIADWQMEALGYPKNASYRISNPLSDEWVYMRPSLWATMLPIIRYNLTNRKTLSLFEVSMRYEWSSRNLPKERPTLIVAWTGNEFLKAKGVGEAILSKFGIPYESLYEKHVKNRSEYRYGKVQIQFGKYGSCGVIHEDIGKAFQLQVPVTLLNLEIDTLVHDQKFMRTYCAISKFPSAVEDMAFIVPLDFSVGPLLITIKKAHQLVASAVLLDTHEQTRTVRITYQSNVKNLTAADIQPARNAILKAAEEEYGIALKNL